MPRTVAIGNQDFLSIRQDDCFYVDKTQFIADWWKARTKVTLIARPRRFGKTLMMDTIDRFFSTAYSDQEELFSGLGVWYDDEMRALSGKIPVIFLSFANIKEQNFFDARRAVVGRLLCIYRRFGYLSESPKVPQSIQNDLMGLSRDSLNDEVKTSVNILCEAIYCHHGIKPIVLLDEYDTPLQEAWVNGYWDELVDFMRGFMNSTFKTNPYLERGLMTGITRVSKKSIFSDLNNPDVVTMTTPKYATAFGFTEEEVFDAMDEYGLTDKAGVRQWYDGFTIGGVSDIYNPWSVISYLDRREFNAYWSNTSGHALISSEVQKADIDTKADFETLLSGKTITAFVNEEISFKDLQGNAESIWALLIASGYLTVLKRELKVLQYEYTLRLTNLEVQATFENMVRQWFTVRNRTDYNAFLVSLLRMNKSDMNQRLSKLTAEIFSYFDPSGKEPEKFYHGFVLGLLVSLKDRYRITSNKESGYGRYDVMMEPLDREKDDAFILEFKVCNQDETMQESLEDALKQIEDRNYRASLLQAGIENERIHCYGMIFNGKKVLVG